MCPAKRSNWNVSGEKVKLGLTGDWQPEDLYIGDQQPEDLYIGGRLLDDLYIKEVDSQKTYI